MSYRLLVGAAVVAWLAYALSGICSRAWRMVSTLAASPSSQAVRVGLLGAAKIAPYALLYPARRLPDHVRVVSVGARDAARAERLAGQWDVSRSGSYADVLGDGSVEAVYVPLLNGLHYEWAMRSLAAGKHVLVEKPVASNAAEAAAIVRSARERGLVSMEGLDWYHHAARAHMC